MIALDIFQTCKASKVNNFLLILPDNGLEQGMRTTWLSNNHHLLNCGSFSNSQKNAGWWPPHFMAGWVIPVHGLHKSPVYHQPQFRIGKTENRHPTQTQTQIQPNTTQPTNLPTHHGSLNVPVAKDIGRDALLHGHLHRAGHPPRLACAHDAVVADDIWVDSPSWADGDAEWLVNGCLVDG